MKKFLFASLVCVLSVFLLCDVQSFAAAGSVKDEFKRTTRDLVFDDEDDAEAAKKTDEKSQTLALKSTIVLLRDGKKSTVVPSHEFKSGDRIKLVFTPNIDGYVYWLAKGSSGDYTVLFPSEKAGVDNAVKRNQEYTVPVKGTFKFDDKPGKEELLCVLATEKLADIEKIITAKATLKEVTDKLQASADSTGGKDEKRTTRDLVFDDEDEGDVNTKSQTAEKGQPMVTRFVLNHK